jgi:hypothetical protein
MITLADCYVSRGLFASPVPGRVLGANAGRWRRVTNSLFDPYRPELHYMRGPGPKWRAKHGRGGGCASKDALNAPHHQPINRGTHRDELSP